MKKIHHATLIAFIMASANISASDVTVYGIIDTGLKFRNVEADQAANWTALEGNSLTMESGMSLGSRFGFKGSEDLGNGTTIGFVLENGFNSDTGELMSDNLIFGRESQLYIENNFGKLSFGRVALLKSDLGSFGLMGELSAFAAGWGDVGSHTMLFASFDNRRDNTITYVSPSFAGARIHAQYAMGNGSAGNENKSSATGGRYGALAFTYDNANLKFITLIDTLNKNPQETKGSDTITATAGISYKFTPLTIYVAGQYFTHANSVGSSSFKYDLGNEGDIEGYGTTFGARIPAAGGTMRASVGWMDATSDTTHSDVSRFILSGGYEYSFSKRTSCYTAISYTQDSDPADRDPSMILAVAGLRHKF